MSDPTTLIAKLQSSFENAHNTGDLKFFPSTVFTHSDSEIEVINIIKPGHTGLLIMSNFDLVRDPTLPCLATQIRT